MVLKYNANFKFQLLRLKKLTLQFIFIAFRGVTDVLKKRLKTYYREKKLTKAHVPTPKKSLPEFLMVIDFEATCEENNDNYDHEIIEFPVILVCVESKQVVSLKPKD